MLLQDTHLSAGEDPRSLQVGTWEQSLGSGLALSLLPAIPWETLPQGAPVEHPAGHEGLVMPGRGLL